MPRPSRFRRAGKWCGVGVCVVLLVGWGVSRSWKISLIEFGPFVKSTSSVGLIRGFVYYTHNDVDNRYKGNAPESKWGWRIVRLSTTALDSFRVVAGEVENAAVGFNKPAILGRDRGSYALSY